MPYKIIADEVEHALRRLMEKTSVDKTQEQIVDGALGVGAYDRMKEIAAEEAQEIVRKLKENHWRIEREEAAAEAAEQKQQEG